MKKSGVTLIIVAVSLIIVGMLICSAALFSSDFDLKKINTYNMEQKTDTVSESFSSVQIKSNYYDVRLCVSEDGQCRIVRPEDENIKFNIKVENSTLSVTFENNRKWYDHIGINFGYPENTLTVYLPETEYEELSVSSSSGDIYADKSVKFNKVKLESTSGDIDYYGNAATEAVFKSTSGDIEADGINGSVISITTTSAEVSLSNVNADGAVTVSTTSGDVEAESVRCGIFSCSVTSGDIELADLIAAEKLTLSCNSGDVSLNKCDGGSIDIKTTSGSVSASLLSGKLFDCKATSGDVSVPVSDKDAGKCKVKTTSGDIWIKVPPTAEEVE